MMCCCVCETGGEQERDWAAVAAIQCRLDREGGTKLFTDLVMSSKNDKIFHESIQLAICLLEGGNTEIQGQSIAPVMGASALPTQPAEEQREVEAEMGPAVTIMKPILRFLQLLCENHNNDLQTCIVTHESNGIDIITALILNDISPLCRYRMEMVLQLKVPWVTCFYLNTVWRNRYFL
ncbi:hypothetical protein GOODEAATRI_022059 [Goodea atripinnis]|uniref:RyR/IP3R Homology associated domain-containing protein n=1 Tax=Goodea atripinnis TaxID=208336 RepID=A0ABV0P6W4_9TELE